MDNTINVKYFKSIHVIYTDKKDERSCILMIYFLRYRVSLIQKESFDNVPWQTNEHYIIRNKRVFYYSEELTIQYFIKNCLNVNITKSERFKILDKLQLSDP